MDEVVRTVLRLLPHEELVVPKSKWRPPPDAKKTFGELRGQIADWEITLEDGRRIHIVEFEDHYRIHWDIVSPHVDPLKHLRLDARYWYDVLVTALRLAIKRLIR